MKRKGIAALLIGVMTLSLLAGCGSTGESAGSSEGGSASTGDNVTLTFWTNQDKQGALDPVVEAYKEVNPDVTIEVSYYDTSSIKDACKVAAASDTMPSMWFNWGGSLASYYKDAGVTYDLTAYAEENNWDEQFTSSSLALSTFDGELIGYPTAYDVVGIYYRKDIFEQYDLEVPTTFEEFEQICETLKENGVTPISTAGLNGWHVMRLVELFVEMYAGEDGHDALNSFTDSWDSQPVIDALTKYQEFCDKGYFPAGFVTADPSDTMLSMYSGECAMTMEGEWNDNTILAADQDLSQYGVFAFPNDSANRLSAFVNMIQFNADLTDEELTAAMDFMEYYFNEENVAAYGAYYNTPLPRLDAEMPADKPTATELIEMSNENGTFTITDQAFPTEVADVLFSCQDALATDTMTPEDAAAQIQAAVEAYQSK